MSNNEHRCISCLFIVKRRLSYVCMSTSAKSLMSSQIVLMCEAFQASGALKRLHSSMHVHVSSIIFPS